MGSLQSGDRTARFPMAARVEAIVQRIEETAAKGREENGS